MLENLPLNIEPKVDNEMKLSQLHGVPKGFFVSATEFNKIISAINELHQAVKGAIPSNSTIIKLDNAVCGYVHTDLDDLGNEIPFDGDEFVIDLDKVVRNGFSSILFTSQNGEWPTITVINGEGLGVGGSDITEITKTIGSLPGAGNYNINLAYRLKHLLMFSEDASGVSSGSADTVIPATPSITSATWSPNTLTELVIDLAGGDNVTTNEDLTYELYNGITDVFLLSFGSHNDSVANSNDGIVVVSGSTATITPSGGLSTSLTNYKVRIVDEAGNKSNLSANYDATPVVTNKALEFLSTQTDKVDISVPIDTAADWYFAARLKVVSQDGDVALMGSSTGNKFQFGRRESDDNIYLLLGTVGAYIPVSMALDTWVTVKLKYTTADGQIRRYYTTNDGVDEGTDQVGSEPTLAGITTGTITIPIGKYGGGGFLATYQFDWIDANGLTFNMNAIFDNGGTPAIEDNNAVKHNITTDRADANAMLVNLT